MLRKNVSSQNPKLAALKQRFRPLFACSFLQGFVLWYAVERLFMKSIGFTNATITIETVIFTIVMIIANVPLGVLADRWSRKGVLALASLALIVNSAICGFSHGFWPYTLGACFWGLFYACYAGTYDSIVYDTLLEEVGNTDKFAHYYGRIQLFDSLALVLGSLLSTVVTHFAGLQATYFMTIPFVCCSLVALYYFREPTLHRKNRGNVMSAHLTENFKAILHKGQIFWIVTSLVLIGTLLRMMLEFDQFWLIALALPTALYGPVNALLLSSDGLSGFLAGRIKSNAPIVGASILVVASSLVLLMHMRPLIIASQALLLAGLMLLSIVCGRYLHDTMPSHIRAGASSIVTTLGYLFFIPVALFFGAVSSRLSVFRGAWVIVGLAVAMCLSLNIVLAMRRSAPSPTIDVPKQDF